MKPVDGVMSRCGSEIAGMIFAMKKLLVMLMIALASISNVNASVTSDAPYSAKDFEEAVALIKKYETLHTAKHWPLVGYGHKVQPGENFRRGTTLSESQADALLRKDLKKFVDYYKAYGKDSLLLGVLAYNVGPGRVNKSTVLHLLKQGNRNIKSAFEAMCRYKGKVHSQIHKRRVEEYKALFRH
ncbi:MAG: glycoside hydrolase family protein [Muribaculaceae bacterium]|nr:glycoside hydrolase family protein [Muribaculaceae bacterium]MDE6559391.1 glycoside hydrolase family protein [Muribaculaceae bacterium]